MFNRTFLLDLAERVIWTFVQGFLGAWIVLSDALFTEANLKVGLVAGAISAAKCILATRIGDEDDASTLPA